MSHREARHVSPAASGAGQNFAGAMARASAGNDLGSGRDSNDLVAESTADCFACGQPIRVGWVVRITSAGTRHDVCP